MHPRNRQGNQITPSDVEGDEHRQQERPLTTIEIATDLYPTPAQRAQLQKQHEIVSRLWKLLAAQHHHDQTGHEVTLSQLHGGYAPVPTASTHAQMRRTTRQRSAESCALAQQVGWTVDVAAVTLGDLVAEFSRRARAAPVSASLPADYRLYLGPLARTVGELAVEISGLDTLVPAALFALPASVRRALAVEEMVRIERLDAQCRALALAAGTGDPGANAALTSHLARWGAALTHARPPMEAPGSLVTLTLLERTRLTWAPAAEGGGPRLAWTFHVDAVALPGRRGLVACDPGMQRLWTTQSAAGIRRFINPIHQNVWRPPGAATASGSLQRPHDQHLGELLRRALLIRHWLHSVQQAAEDHVLSHPAVALEIPDLAGFARLRADYVRWAAWSGATTQFRYLAAIAGVSRKLILIPASAAATRTCAACHKRGSMQFRRRSGRCRECRVRGDRDDNAARNLHRLGMEHL